MQPKISATKVTGNQGLIPEREPDKQLPHPRKAASYPLPTRGGIKEGGKLAVVLQKFSSALIMNKLSGHGIVARTNELK
ncbi:hypothetical protein chiPu_0014440 [Chiloscyllium punctatum]|uniref:Uncharacterized protein n=1 Tax=Chiloscyllium punctatum TaxID=137246 RepID=A0A401SZY8_CHIPU|nr:hypothetical protein [Chiloscyllium punctatum]